jgi:peptide deformylase
MATYPLLENNNPILSIPLSGCSEDLDRQELKDNLIETMKQYHGIGLSAIQCGIMERMFVMYSDVSKKEIITCFNPKIVNQSPETILMDEGCLTYPGLWLKVRRPEAIACAYENEEKEIQEVQMYGLESRIFQHEYDHMEGTNFTEQVSKMKLKMAKKRVAKMKKKSMFSTT